MGNHIGVNPRPPACPCSPTLKKVEQIGTGLNEKSISEKAENRSRADLLRQSGISNGSNPAATSLELWKENQPRHLDIPVLQENVFVVGKGVRFSRVANYSAYFTTTISNCPCGITTPANDNWIVYDSIAAILSALISAVIILANLIVLLNVVLMLTRSHVIWKRPISYMFIVNLAVADLCVGIVSLSNFALNLARGGNELHRTCLIQISFTVLPCAASVFSMTIVSVDRYLTIMHPLKYQVFIKIWKGIFIIVIAWTFALLIGFAPFMGWSIINEDFTSAGSNCTFLHIVDSSYVIFMFFGLFLPQLFLVIYLYFKIFKVTRKHTKLLARSKNTPRTSSTRENEFEFDAEHRNRPRFTQSCPVSPVMSRINIRKDTNFALRNIHSRTVNFNPVSINIEPENNQSVSSLSNSSVFFEPTNDKETKPKLPSMSLPGSAVLPEALPKAATTTYEYVTFDNALRSHTRRKNDAHKLRRTVSYAGSAAISSFALQLSHKLKSYSRLGRVVPKRDLKALRTVAMVIGFFCLMWTPFQIVSIIQEICGRECHLENLVGTYLLILGIANSAINPLVYTYTNKELKNNLFQLCCCKRHQRKIVTNHQATVSESAPSNQTQNFLTVPSNAWNCARDVSSVTTPRHTDVRTRTNTVPSVSASISRCNVIRRTSSNEEMSRSSGIASKSRVSLGPVRNMKGGLFRHNATRPCILHS